MEFLKRFDFPVPELHPEEKGLMSCFSEYLTEVGYNRANFEPYFSGGGIPARKVPLIPGYLYEFGLNLGETLTDLACLFLFHLPLPREQVEASLSPQLLESLLRCDLMYEDELGVRSRHDVYPVLDSHIFTDGMVAERQEVHRYNVYYLGGDSYELADLVSRRPRKRALDLCTGSGVHAVLAGKHVEEVHGVDINPRALGVCKINAWVNRVAERCSFYLGDLYRALPPGKYDLITANPPFVPTADKLSLFRGGGEGGEEITRRIFAGLPERLNPGGELCLVTTFPYLKGVDLMQHCRSWIEEERGWGIGLLSREDQDNASYIAGHYDGSGSPGENFQEMLRWMKLYQENKIEKMGFGTYFARRLEEPADDWTCHLQVPPAHRLTAEDVERWLDGWTQFGGQTWRSQWRERELRLADDVILWNDGSGRGKIEFRDSQWPWVDLDPEAHAVAQKLRQQPGTAAGELCQNLETIISLGTQRVLQPHSGS